MVLEYADVQNFALTEKVSEGVTSLQVSGLAFHSALAVERMVTEVQADTLCLKLVLVPARRELSGSFNYTVRVPETVRCVVFGNRRHVVWRSTGR